MFRMPFVFSIVLISLTAGNCRADILPLFSDVPSTYIPGTPFTFQIVLPDGLNGVSAYQVGLVFDAQVDSPPLTVSAAPTVPGYIFPTTTNFTSNSFSGPGANEVSLQFSDSVPPANYIFTMPGQDLLATITVNPDITMTGQITISFTSDTLVTYFTEGFDSTPPSVTIDQGCPPAPSVPAPAGWITLALGSLILIGRNRILKRSQASLS
jgi:hypothetical protein